MRRFLIRLFIFVLPFILAAISILAFAWSFGEAKPQAWFAEVPYTEPIVYFPSWQREDIANFKLEMTLLRQPEVLILGSSRTLEISSQIFNLAPNAIYNGGIDGASINENWQFISLLAAENKMPDVLILQLDYPDYNANSVTFRNREVDIRLPSLNADLRQFRQSLIPVGRELFTNPQIFFGSHAEFGEGYQFVGLSALKTGIGYLADGREYNPHLTSEIIQRSLDEQIAAFESRGRQYEIGQNLSERDMESLRNILETAQEHGTIVIGYFPPYISRVYDEMMGSSDFAYIDASQTAITALFESYGYPVFDFSDAGSVGGSDAEMYDSWHSGQLLNMRLFLTMRVNAPEILGAYIDPDLLSEAIENAENPFYVYFP